MFGWSVDIEETNGKACCYCEEESADGKYYAVVCEERVVFEGPACKACAKAREKYAPGFLNDLLNEEAEADEARREDEARARRKGEW